MDKFKNVLWVLIGLTIPLALLYGAITQINKGKRQNREATSVEPQVSQDLPDWPTQLVEELVAPNPLEEVDRDRLLRMCVEETRNAPNGPQAACEKFASVDRQRLALQPYSPPRLPSRPTPRAPHVSTPTYSSSYDVHLRFAKLFSEQCRVHVKGSIKYRDCRSDTSRSLTNKCRDLNAQADQLSGNERTELLLQARAWCWVSDRYHIIN